MTISRLLSLIPLAVLSLVFALAQGASAAGQIQERNLTDDVSPPAKTAPQPAAVDNAKPSGVEARPSAAPAKSSSSDWEAPAGDKVGKQSPPAKKSEPAPQRAEPATADSGPGSPSEDVFDMADKEKTYGKNEIDREVMGFFEGGSQGVASLIAKAFKDLGRPTGFIKGGEGAGALVVGLRYGEGKLKLKNGQSREVYWQSPTIGFDIGADAAKVFVLVYSMEDADKIFQRFPGVDGSAYFIGGFGMNYQRSGNIVLAPIRFGVGLRLGANVGYMNYSRERTINPF
ncbi:MAG: DUF1134 domain-containing protein [Desulfovibrionaceae bacterium]|nr:DUF1134 domain-containing protein [Desulfovibrionaceae bacterium]MBF0512752.1 DUF1134 domain-containing protein [Desulfovibrionaceae bacterium]